MENTIMTENELRLGNWVEYGKNYKVAAILYEQIYLEGYPNIEKSIHIHNINPIPLTPEIFNMVGTPYSTDASTWVIGDRKPIFIQWYDTTQKRFWFNNNYMGIIHLEFVHELQNLIHSLTHTDLKIKM